MQNLAHLTERQSFGCRLDRTRCQTARQRLPRTLALLIQFKRALTGRLAAHHDRADRRTDDRNRTCRHHRRIARKGNALFGQPARRRRKTGLGVCLCLVCLAQHALRPFVRVYAFVYGQLVLAFFNLLQLIVNRLIICRNRAVRCCAVHTLQGEFKRLLLLLKLAVFLVLAALLHVRARLTRGVHEGRQRSDPPLADSLHAVAETVRRVPQINVFLHIGKRVFVRIGGFQPVHDIIRVVARLIVQAVPLQNAAHFIGKLLTCPVAALRVLFCPCLIRAVKQVIQRLVRVVAGLAAEIVLVQSLRRLHGGRVDGCLVLLAHHARGMQQLRCLIQPFGRLAAVGHAHAGCHFVSVLIKRGTGLRVVLVTELAPQGIVLRMQLRLSVRIACRVPVHGVLEELRQRQVAVSAALSGCRYVLPRIAPLLCRLPCRKQLILLTCRIRLTSCHAAAGQIGACRLPYIVLLRVPAACARKALPCVPALLKNSVPLLRSRIRLTSCRAAAGQISACRPLCILVRLHALLLSVARRRCAAAVVLLCRLLRNNLWHLQQRGRFVLVFLLLVIAVKTHMNLLKREGGENRRLLA